MAFQIEFKPKAVKDMDKLTSDIAFRVIKNLNPCGLG
jgi:mRNA-degrading endonuclease RelE of RelBE toxin-antitoxin system